MRCNRFLIGVVVLSLVQISFAKGNRLSDYEPGFYIGIQGGRAWTNEGSGPEDLANKVYDLTQQPKSRDINKRKFGGKVFVGYSFIPYFSLDGGFTLYPSNEFKAEGDNGGGAKNIYNFKTNFFTIDLMAKCILPLEILSSKLNGWNLYAKLGTALTSVRYRYGINSPRDNFDEKYSEFSVRPCYALGLGYNFTDNFSADLSWSGVYSWNEMGSDMGRRYLDSKDSKPIPSAYMAAIGICYKINI